MQTSHEGTLNAVMNALMEHRANQANTKKELPELEKKALLNQKVLANDKSGFKSWNERFIKRVLEPVKSSRTS